MYFIKKSLIDFFYIFQLHITYFFSLSFALNMPELLLRRSNICKDVSLKVTKTKEMPDIIPSRRGVGICDVGGFSNETHRGIRNVASAGNLNWKFMICARLFLRNEFWKVTTFLPKLPWQFFVFVDIFRKKFKLFFQDVNHKFCHFCYNVTAIEFLKSNWSFRRLFSEESTFRIIWRFTLTMINF